MLKHALRWILVACGLILLCPEWLLCQTSSPQMEDESRYYNTALRLKNGVVLVGKVQYDEITDRFEVKQSDGTITSVLGKHVITAESHARTFLPPEYRAVNPFYQCDMRQRENEWYFLELRGWGMYNGTDDSRTNIGLPAFTLGGDAAFGLRFGRFGAGVGTSFFRANDISRIPVYIHLKYHLMANCLAPYLYAQGGTVFDNQSGERIAMDRITHPGPKIAGVGFGYDLALNPWIDLSADLGYRYMQLPTEADCDCSDQPEVRRTVFHNESHSIILRIGVTF